MNEDGTMADGYGNGTMGDGTMSGSFGLKVEPTDPYYNGLYLAWGFMHLYTIVLGAELYYLYPWAIKNHAFWK
jgi:hypothetical protein